jgi:hypothetical protein
VGLVLAIGVLIENKHNESTHDKLCIDFIDSLYSSIE